MKGSNRQSKAGTPRIIGWREVIAIPEWGISALEAKVDTGARSSALDVTRIEELPGDRVRFEVVLHRRKRQRRREVEAPISRRTRVRSSNGQMRDRLMVVATVRIGSLERPVEFGLVCRRRMICRALLGRSALEGHFLVDPSLRHTVDSEPESESSSS